MGLTSGATQIGWVPYLAISHTDIEIPMERSEQAQYLAEICSVVPSYTDMY
jgi:hypothetical protein